MSNEQVYPLIAASFATEIKRVWSSEETMAAAYEELLQATKTEFDRTQHAALLTQKLFERCWSAQITDFKAIAYDITEILKSLHGILDYNLFTQVYQNMNAFTLRYDSSAADREVVRALEILTPELKKDLDGPKPKYAAEDKIPDGMTRSYYNTVIAARKMGALNPFTSFRISPSNSTPAFADSSNFSGFSIYLDQFLEVNDPNRKVAVLRWTSAEVKDLCVGMESQPGGGIVMHFDDIEVPIVSKCGGTILQQVMFARKLMYDFLREFGFEFQISPRLFSLTVTLTTLATQWPWRLLPMANGWSPAATTRKQRSGTSPPVRLSRRCPAILERCMRSSSRPTASCWRRRT